MSSPTSRTDRTNTLANEPTTRRHARDDPDRDAPTDVHDPHDRDDADTPGFLERVKPKTWGQWSAVFMTSSLLLAGVVYVTRLYPPGYHNPHMIVHGLLIGILPVVALFFREQGFKARGMLDTVVVKLGSPTTGLNSLVMLGEVESSPGGYRLAKEVKRITYGGFVGDWLRLDDVLAADDLDLDSKKHRDPDSPSKLELDGRFTATTKTELHGDVFVTDADDLEYDYDSRDVERRTTPPAYIDEGSTGMLIKELQYAQKREDAARDEIEVIENRLESVRKRVEDESIPELDRALKVLDRLQNDTLADRRGRRADILPEERSSSVSEIDEDVDEEMNRGGS
jgi:hypothetical protein